MTDPQSKAVMYLYYTLFKGACQVTNEQLAGFIQQGGNDELLPLLWDKTRKIIFKKCNQYWRFYSEKLGRFGYSLDDLQQEGYNALVLAVKGYKSKKGYKFTTYLTYALKRVIRDLMSGSDVLSRSTTQSLEQPLGESSDGDLLLIGDIIADERAAEPFEEIERLDEYQPLYDAVNSLKPDLREIIQEHYFRGLTYKQIGEQNGYSAERVRQIHDKAINALRTGKTGVMLKLVYGMNYKPSTYAKHKGLSAFRSSQTSELEDYVLYKAEEEKPLYPMQKRFCEEYLIDLDPTQAAIRAGYSEKTAGVTAERLLSRRNINRYIQELLWE